MKKTREQKIVGGFFIVAIIGVIICVAVFTFNLFSVKKMNEVEKIKMEELNKIGIALDKYKKEIGFYPSPDAAISILAGKGNFVLFQGETGESFLKQLGLEGLQHKDYTYTITPAGEKYQLLAFLPDGSVITKGNRLGIFVDKNDVPFQDLEDAPSDIVNTDELFYVYFDDKIKITASDRKLTPIMHIATYEYDPALMGYWNMETMSKNGKLFDLSGNGFHGYLDAGLNAGTVPGVVGKAMEFNGELQRVLLNDFAKTLEDMTDYSFSFFFKNAEIIEEGKFNTALGITNGSFAAILRIAPNNFEEFEEYDDGEWHSVVVTAKARAKTPDIYVDGEKVNMKNFAGNLVFESSNDMNIGFSGIQNDYYKGQLDEVRVYKKILSQEEIDELHSLIK